MNPDTSEAAAEIKVFTESKEKELGLKFFGRSIPSIAHPERNEDSIAHSPTRGIALLLDGMGGLDAGDKASRLARNEITEALTAIPQNTDPETVRRLMNKLLIDASERVGTEIPGSGTTATVAKFIETNGTRRVIIGHVGDSRAYLLREGKLRQITQDDNVASATGASLEDAKRIGEMLDQVATDKDLVLLSEQERFYFQNRNAIGQNLGTGAPPIPHIYHVALLDGDKLILTSDGVHDNLTRDEIAQIVSSVQPDLTLALTEKAKARSMEVGKHIRAKPDDISAVIIEVEPRGLQQTPIKERQPSIPKDPSDAINKLNELLLPNNLYSHLSEIFARRALIEASRDSSLTPDQASRLIQLYAEYQHLANAVQLTRQFSTTDGLDLDTFDRTMQAIFAKANRPFPQKPWWVSLKK